MPIPYMGSKRKSAQQIFQTIKNFNPQSKTIVDLFCGGFAISEIFIKNGWRVISNDKNKYVAALINQIAKGLDERKCLEFVHREKFIDISENPNNYEDWYVGYVQCCWSFGNNQKGYLFGKDVEPVKFAGHELVINKNSEYILKLIPNFPKKYIDGILSQKNWHTRRIALVKVSNVLQNRKLELEQLQQLERLQQLEQLQRLERLEQLQRLETEVTCKSYNEIEIPEDAIIYCDPPYKGTAEYKEGSFNHVEFWDWVREKSKTNKIYISEYSAPKDFISILEFAQKSTLGGGGQKHNNQPKECVFVPVGQEKQSTN
jgi:site-specific DNA-adenine methylase